ncbi:MAG: pyridoxamine 5'-phosphate oxidase family protein [Acidimicrobiia bacterium]
MRTPRRDRPQIPDGYGVPSTGNGLRGWPAVEERLQASPQYWMATTRPDGRPHVVPRWGVWLGGRLWYDGSPDTVHVHNLAANPACVLHLEDGRQAVIIEGTSGPAVPPGLEFGARIAAGFSDKYAGSGSSPQPDAWEGPDAGGLLLFTPRKAIAWFDFPTDVTRFHF